MPGKITQRVIGFTVVCALLAGCLAGCGLIGNHDTSRRPDAQESREPVSGDNTAEAPSTAPPAETSPAATAPTETSPAATSPAETAPAVTPPAETSPAATPPAEISPAAKTLLRETVTTTYDYGYDSGVSVSVTEYSGNGLGIRVYSDGDSGNETYKASYDYDANGAPTRMRIGLGIGIDVPIEIEITNTYENGRITSAQISDMLINGRSYLNTVTESYPTLFYAYLSTLLRCLQHYEGYKDAVISIRNTETCVRLQYGEVVYSCSDMGEVKTITEIKQDGNGHKIQLVTTVTPNSENDRPATMAEADEFGRIVKYGAVMGQQSMIMRVDYETQPGSDARQRTEVGRVTDIQNDLDMEYSNDELEELAEQLSFTYTFADDVLVFSEIRLGTQKTTCEYSADGLLLRQTVETNTEGFSQSVVTEYEYQ